MPIERKLLPGGGSLLVGTGTLTGTEILVAINAVHQTEEKTREIVFQIGDFRLVEKVELPTEDIKSVAERDRLTATINPNLITAVVAEKDILFGLSRMWEIFISDAPGDTAVFRSMDEAKSWVAEQIKLRGVARE